MRLAWAVALLLFAATAVRAQTTAKPDDEVDARNAAIAAACQLVKRDDGHMTLDRRCIEALAFDTRAYFGAGTIDEDVYSPAGIVDASDYQAFRGPVWAFAIDQACPGRPSFDPSCPIEQSRLLMRAVTIDKVTERPREWVGVWPKAANELRRFLDAVANWREADLRSCPGAAKTLTSLGDFRLPAFDDRTRRLIAGQPPRLEDVVVIADGDTIAVRGGAGMSTFHTSDKGQAGSVGNWAARMMDIARPCLKPTSAPAPWTEPKP